MAGWGPLLSNESDARGEAVSSCSTAACHGHIESVALTFTLSLEFQRHVHVMLQRLTWHWQ